MKASLREKRTWVRMGWELAALEKLAIDILCDGEYQAVMSKAAMSRLSRDKDKSPLLHPLLSLLSLLSFCLWVENDFFRRPSAGVHLVNTDIPTVNQYLQLGEYFLEHTRAAFQIMGLTESKEVKDAKYILKSASWSASGDTLIIRASPKSGIDSNAPIAALYACSASWRIGWVLYRRWPTRDFGSA